MSDRVTQHDQLLAMAKEGTSLGSAHVWLRPSKSEPNTYHAVLFFPNIPMWMCMTPCDGFHYNDTCYHIQEVKDSVGL
jgi:hypothetical protein